MKKFLAPAIALMDRLRYPKKFALIGLLFVFSLGVMTYMVISEARVSLNFTKKEKLGIEYIYPVRKLLENLQQHRGMTNALLSGDKSFSQKISEKQIQIEEDIKRIVEIDKKYGNTLKSTEKLNAIKNKWQDLKDRVSGLKPKESFELHTALITDTLSFISHVADTSNLILDPELDSYYLMDLIVSKLPLLTETIGQARGMGAGIAARKTITPDEKFNLTILYSQIKSTIEASNTSLQTAANENPGLKPKLEGRAREGISSTNDFLKVLDSRLLKVGKIDIAPKDYFDASTAAIGANFTLYDNIAPSLEGLLKTRIEKLLRRIYIASFIAVFMIIAVTYLFIAFYISTMDAVTELKKAAISTASGDLTVEIKHKGQDELGEVLLAMNGMTEKLKGTILDLKSAADTMASAGQQLSASSEEMSRGVTEQAGRASQIAGSATEMSQTLVNIARNTSGIAVSATETSKTAKNGEYIVNKSIDDVKTIADTVTESSKLMVSLGNRSRQIGEIVNVINDIADQTNLLALNAAIEAARAGEQGRGFSVVADEVRKLAEKTGKATSEINEMIKAVQDETQMAVVSMEEVTKRVSEGVECSAKAGGTLHDIVQSVGNLHSMVQQIATATDEMSSVADHISGDIDAIANISRDTSASSTQIAQSSSDLARLSSNLQRMVGQFKI